MAILNVNNPIRKNNMRMALVVTRREVRDSFRDWRIIIPILLLTVGFPALMNFTAGRILTFVRNYGAELLGNQLIPFLLLVVGFFPMSFSLIIALETFVGEKERRSLEPLLATPLTNTQLYVGKMLAALIPPLLASYLGMGVYVGGLWLFQDWTADLNLLLQIFSLTTIQGVIMVAAAVVISSQVTSVRAANLLASFIIVPMALLIQAEAAALFWGNRAGLWWLALALLLTAVLLIRMGIQLFNREELMGQEIDQLRLGWMWRHFWQRFSGRLPGTRYPNPLAWYRETWRILPQLKGAAVTMSIAWLGAIGLGILLAQRYALPPTMQSQFSGDSLRENLRYLDVLLVALPSFIILQNVRVVALQTVLGVFTFGVLGILIFMLPWTLLAFIATQFYLAGENPFLFVWATVVPHAVIELPALLLAAAAGLRWNMVAIAPPSGRSLSESFLTAAANFMRVFVGLVIPLLIVAAFVEAYVTPQVLARIYGS